MCSAPDGSSTMTGDGQGGPGQDVGLHQFGKERLSAPATFGHRLGDEVQERFPVLVGEGPSVSHERTVRLRVFLDKSRSAQVPISCRLRRRTSTATGSMRSTT